MHLGVSSDFLVRELKERVASGWLRLEVGASLGHGTWKLARDDELQHQMGCILWLQHAVFDQAHTQIDFKRILPFSANLVSFEFHCQN